MCGRPCLSTIGLPGKKRSCRRCCRYRMQSGAMPSLDIPEVKIFWSVVDSSSCKNGHGLIMYRWRQVRGWCAFSAVSLISPVLRRAAHMGADFRTGDFLWRRLKEVKVAHRVTWPNSSHTFSNFVVMSDVRNKHCWLGVNNVCVVYM